mmetsp:Transcript_35095/g.99531  ORF Transcript_35095/g.99531 Transcript_35095/m.99531 type:complete len:429 (-) Transcript_35095:345-1631(-)
MSANLTDPMPGGNSSQAGADHQQTLGMNGTVDALNIINSTVPGVIKDLLNATQPLAGHNTSSEPKHLVRFGQEAHGGLYRAGVHDALHSHHGPAHHGHREMDPAPFTTVLTFYAIMICMIAAQTGLFWWKKNHKRSYELVTLLGLWLFPAITCIVMHFWRFLMVWVLFTAVTGYLLSLCLARPMDRTTPRKVYTWFLVLYKVSVFIGSFGYFLLLAFYFLEVFGLHHLVHDVISKVITPSAAILWIWYGLYFGILGRDSAEVCADTMSKRLGTGRKLSVSVNSCGICAQELRDFTHLGEQQGEGYEKTVQLACKHLFHSGCIRGWTIVGKKDSCPVCNEKVDMRSLYSDRPWETRNLSWIQMLDAVRYMVVWNPLILLGLHAVFAFFGLDHSHDQHHPLHAMPIDSSGHAATAHQPVPAGHAVLSHAM